MRPLVQTAITEFPNIGLEDVVHQLFEGALGDAVDEWNTEADFVLGRMCVATVYYAVNRGVNFLHGEKRWTGVTQVENSLNRRGTSNRNANRRHCSRNNKGCDQSIGVKGSFVQKQGGMFVCPIPGCGKAEKRDWRTVRSFNTGRARFVSRVLTVPNARKASTKSLRSLGMYVRTTPWLIRTSARSAKASGPDLLV